MGLLFPLSSLRFVLLSGFSSGLEVIHSPFLGTSKSLMMIVLLLFSSSSPLVDRDNLSPSPPFLFLAPRQ